MLMNDIFKSDGTFDYKERQKMFRKRAHMGWYTRPSHLRYAVVGKTKNTKHTRAHSQDSTVTSRKGKISRNVSVNG